MAPATPASPNPVYNAPAATAFQPVSGPELVRTTWRTNPSRTPSQAVSTPDTASTATTSQWRGLDPSRRTSIGAKDTLLPQSCEPFGAAVHAPDGRIGQTSQLPHRHRPGRPGLGPGTWPDRHPLPAGAERL